MGISLSLEMVVVVVTELVAVTFRRNGGDDISQNF